MKIQQFEDKSLSHYAYAILDEHEKQILLIDPARDITAYLAFAKAHEANITGVIETHPHADFVSSHLELHQNFGAKIYCSKLVDAAYPHQTFDDNDEILLGNIKLKAINTPGHSPDSISIILEHNGKNHAVFTGDTLFIGDCGRPDLRENVGNIIAKRAELAAKMYHSLRQKLMVLADDVLVYPAHGAGTLCGKALSDASSSTIGLEKISNWALQNQTETAFVKALIEQSFVPKYFSFDVELNKKGAPDLTSSLQKINYLKSDFIDLEKDTLIVDTRPASKFKSGHLPNSINLMQTGKFETWLGSIISPDEQFYLTAENDRILQEMIRRTAKIGYEKLIKAAFVFGFGPVKTALLDVEKFKKHLADYQIVDIRNANEVKEHPIFAGSIHIPLPQLRERIREISAEKPIVVHCAGGYRSAAGSSIIENYLLKTVSVFDLGDAVNSF